MTDYNLNLTGAEIDAALNNVHSADTSPTQDSTKMVTSGGIKTYVDNVAANPVTLSYDAATKTLTITNN